MKLQLVLSGLEANLRIGGGRSYFPLVRHVPPDFPKISIIWSALQHCQPVHDKIQTLITPIAHAKSIT